MTNESNFQKVKSYLLELEYSIIAENAEDEYFRVEKEEAGIINMFLSCAGPILIMEQYLFELKKEDAKIYKQLLQKNQDIIHGALVLDEETGRKVIFRDTLQLEHLDLNELEATFNSLSLLLSEYSNKIIEFSKA